MIDKYRNWKTSIVFFIFVICFVYAVYKENVALAESTGFVALASWGLLKASSDTLNSVMLSFSEAIKNKWSK